MIERVAGNKYIINDVKGRRKSWGFYDEIYRFIEAPYEETGEEINEWMHY